MRTEPSPATLAAAFFVSCLATALSASPAAAQRATPQDRSDLSAAFTTGKFHWRVGDPLLSVDPKRLPPSAEHPWVAVKDPSIVRYADRWHLFCTLRKQKEGEGRIRLRFGWTVSHYLTGMYEQFTKTNLLELQHLSSNHSVRIYEMCAQFRSTGYKIVNISDLKRALCLEDKYKLFRDFRVKVIEPSIAEINKNTDLRIKVNYLKKGRAFDRIEFIIKEKPRKAEQQLELDVDDSKKDKHATRKKISDIQDTDW